MLTLPPGFVTVRDAYETVGSEKQCNIIAVVVDNLPITKSRRDWMAKVTLRDHSGFEGLGAPFRFFNPDEKKLPVIGKNGDVLLIRNMKVKDFGEVIGLTNTMTEWAVLEGTSLAGIPEEDLGRVDFTQSTARKFGPPTTAEVLYAKQLLEIIDPGTIQQPAKPTSLQVANIMVASGGAAPPIARDKFSLIKDIMPPTGPGEMIFKDLLGEVRRIYKTDTRMSIYVTDYTSHDLLYDYKYGGDYGGHDGDPFGYVTETIKLWPGPHGHMTMQCTLWDAHARFAHKELQEGNYVNLKNVHIKMDKNNAILEGHCRGDKMSTSKINVTIVKPVEADSNDHLRDLLRRKRAVEKAEGAKFSHDPTKIRKRVEAAAETAKETIAKGKADRSRKRRENKRRKKNTGGVDILEDSEETEPKRNSNADFRYSTNAEVRVMKFAVPPKPIFEIMDREILARKTPKGNKFYLPFQNCKYKSLVRVVDFFPDDIADFAAPYRNSDYDLLRDQEEDSDVDMTGMDDSEIKWEWRFFLVVEDASRPVGQESAYMELLVSDDEGDHLLNMEPSNLRKNHQALAQLKEKLFVLWGDLMELKEESPQSQAVTDLRPRARPFECLIKEYGVEARNEDGVKKGGDEYERIFRLWGTTIKG